MKLRRRIYYTLFNGNIDFRRPDRLSTSASYSFKNYCIARTKRSALRRALRIGPGTEIYKEYLQGDGMRTSGCIGVIPDDVRVFRLYDQRALLLPPSTNLADILTTSLMYGRMGNLFLHADHPYNYPSWEHSQYPAPSDARIAIRNVIENSPIPNTIIRDIIFAVKMRENG